MGSMAHCHRAHVGRPCVGTRVSLCAHTQSPSRQPGDGSFPLYSWRLRKEEAGRAGLLLDEGKTNRPRWEAKARPRSGWGVALTRFLPSVVAATLDRRLDPIRKVLLQEMGLPRLGQLPQLLHSS